MLFRTNRAVYAYPSTTPTRQPSGKFVTTIPSIRRLPPRIAIHPSRQAEILCRCHVGNVLHDVPRLQHDLSDEQDGLDQEQWRRYGQRYPWTAQDWQGDWAVSRPGSDAPSGRYQSRNESEVPCAQPGGGGSGMCFCLMVEKR